MDFLDYINPLKLFPHDQYVSFWQTAFNTVLKGFWARFLAVIFFVLSIWLISKKQTRLSLIGMLFVFTIAYGFSILKFIGVIK